MLRFAQLLLLLPLLCACESLTDDGETAVEPIRLDRIDAYYGAIEVITNGAQAVLVGTARDGTGPYRYERLNLVKSRTDGQDFTFDRRLSPAEYELLVGHIRTALQQVDPPGSSLTGIYLVLSPEYEQAGIGPDLRGRLAAEFPGLRVRELTPEREARANFFVMQGRTDIRFDEMVLVDIGAANTILSVFDYPVDTALTVRELPYGTRSTIYEIDPLSDLRVNRLNQRLRIERLVTELTELPLKRTLRQPEFDGRDKVIFMGGLVYKIIRTLDVPLTGRPIDFSKASKAELAARFRTLLTSPNPDLSAGPTYTAEELYSALTILEIIMQELGDEGSAYFFERSTWLPGLVLDELHRADQEKGS